MAEVRIAPEDVLLTGIEATYTGGLLTTNTYKVRNSGRVILHFLKGAAVDCVVTIPTPKTVAGLAVADTAVTVPATTGDKFIGPFPRDLYNDGSNDISFTLSDVDTLTVAVLEI